MMLAIALCLAAAAVDASHDGAFASIGHCIAGIRPTNFSSSVPANGMQRVDVVREKL